MPNSYDASRNPSAAYARNDSDPAGLIVALTPNDTADLAVYVKALRIYVPQSVAEVSLRVTPTLADDDANTVTLHFPAGLAYEPLSVRRVWATGTSPEVEIHGYMS